MSGGAHHAQLLIASNVTRLKVLEDDTSDATVEGLDLGRVDVSTVSQAAVQIAVSAAGVQLLSAVIPGSAVASP